MQPAPSASGRAGARALSRDVRLCGPGSGLAQRLERSGGLPTAIRIQIRDAATDRTLAASTATLVHAELAADCIAAEVSPIAWIGRLLPTNVRLSNA